MRVSITSPEPLEPWITEAVLLESFEPGISVDRYIQEPAPFNTKVRAAACLPATGTPAAPVCQHAIYIATTSRRMHLPFNLSAGALIFDTGVPSPSPVSEPYL